MRNQGQREEPGKTCLRIFLMSATLLVLNSLKFLPVLPKVLQKIDNRKLSKLCPRLAPCADTLSWSRNDSPPPPRRCATSSERLRKRPVHVLNRAPRFDEEPELHENSDDEKHDPLHEHADEVAGDQVPLKRRAYLALFACRENEE